MFDYVLRAMAGVLVVVGLVPDRLEKALNSVSSLAGWFWRHRTRHIHIRVLLRQANLGEIIDEWIADREVCVSLVEVSGLTSEQLLVLGSAHDSGFAVAAWSAYAAWGAHFFCRHISWMVLWCHWRLSGTASRWS